MTKIDRIRTSTIDTRRIISIVKPADLFDGVFSIWPFSVTISSDSYINWEENDS